jgi:hypothetical protein
MAKQTITKLIDDLDHGEADETVKFGLDGVQYEIDLSSKNAAALRDALAPYVTAGSRVGRASTGGGGGGRRRGAQALDREQNRAIREWARSKGIKVSDRGRISDDTVAKYHAAAGR